MPWPPPPRERGSRARTRRRSVSASRRSCSRAAPRGSSRASGRRSRWRRREPGPGPQTRRGHARRDERRPLDARAEEPRTPDAAVAGGECHARRPGSPYRGPRGAALVRLDRVREPQRGRGGARAAAGRPAGVRVAALGKASAQVLRQRGWPVDLVPHEANAAALIATFAAQWQPSDAGVRVLYPASSRALPTIAAGLTQLGAQVTQVEAYRTEGSALDVDDCRAWIARGGVGAVTFASPSAVTELARALGVEDFERLLSGAAAVAIGRTTARELSARGHTAVVAESATLEGLARTTLRVLQQKRA
ncbi:MAG: uroporphyrinogen-III synthase [Gammaproteobacteria bacterium]|nr:MAG: uroporphyrinogen-III synthase [Gammaproteobacteria bacterium]